jgi:hypothetical protein
VFNKAQQVRRLAGAAVVAALVALSLSAPPASAAAGDGYVRLAHLSPDTPAVDVYLKNGNGKSAAQVFPGVAYGAMSDYLRLPVGTYQVAMRKSGAAATTKPVLTAEVVVQAGAAYTVAGVGRYADLGLRVLRDDLRLPSADKSKVRVIQASAKAPVLDVSGAGGATIADGVAFATTTAYKQVSPGKWVVKVQPSGGGRATELPCTLGAGNVYSLLVLDTGNGGLKPELHIDAGRQGTVPEGGVQTGAGGSQPRSNLPMALLLAGIAAALSGGLVAAVRRRPRLS